MKRREVLKSLTSLTAALSLPVIPEEFFALGRELMARRGPTYDLRTLSPDQNETVAQIAERIIPETDTPGAKAARVNEFIDLVLTEWFTPDERDRFLQGLDALDQESLAAHAKRFKDCEESQQDELLRAQEARVKPAGQLKVMEIPPPEELAGQPFFGVMKWLTLLGYFTSEAGVKEELRLEIAHRSFLGCAPMPRR